MANDRLKAVIQAGIKTYTGREVKEVNLCPDPKVAGTWAIRSTLEAHVRYAKNGSGKVTRREPEKVVDFLIVGDYIPKRIVECNPEEIAENLEECSFSSWPPVSDRLRFF